MEIKNYWVTLVRNLEEMKALADTEDIEILALYQEISDILTEQFIETATIEGIARWEKLLKVQSFADDTVDSRRFRIRSKWANLLPYTYGQLENRLSQIVGEGGYEITLNAGAYALTILVNLGNRRMLVDAQEIVSAMAPANLTVTVGLRYNRYKDLRRFTYAQLRAFTYKALKEEVLP